MLFSAHLYLLIWASSVAGTAGNANKSRDPRMFGEKQFISAALAARIPIQRLSPEPAGPCLLHSHSKDGGQSALGTHGSGSYLCTTGSARMLVVF